MNLFITLMVILLLGAEGITLLGCSSVRVSGKVVNTMFRKPLGELHCIYHFGVLGHKCEVI